MSRSSRYPLELKIRVVQKYITGESSMRELARVNNIDKTTVRDWITNYQSMDVEGLAVKNFNASYSAELKQSAVEEYLSGKQSQPAIQKKYRLRSTAQLRSWIKKHNNHEDFRQPDSKGGIYMMKGRKTTQEERIEIVSYCISHNRDYGRAVKHYGVSYHQIYIWVRKYDSEGVDGLLDRRGKRKDESSMSENDKLRAQIKLKEAENLRLKMENDLLKKLQELERGLVKD